MKDNIRQALDMLTKALEEDDVEDNKEMSEVVDEAVEEVTEETGENNEEELETVRTETTVEKFNSETGEGKITKEISFKDGKYYGI